MMVTLISELGVSD